MSPMLSRDYPRKYFRNFSQNIPWILFDIALRKILQEFLPTDSYKKIFGTSSMNSIRISSRISTGICVRESYRIFSKKSFKKLLCVFFKILYRIFQDPYYNSLMKPPTDFFRHAIGVSLKKIQAAPYFFHGKNSTGSFRNSTRTLQKIFQGTV